MAKPFTILVTGGAGYIGSHAVLALRDAGWPVAVVDNLTTGFRWAVPEGVPFYEGDIEDSALLARIIKDENIGAIMHFAGSIIVPESVENPLKYYHNNSAKSRSLIESAVTGGVDHFIFSSTAATYGMPEEVKRLSVGHTRRLEDSILGNQRCPKELRGWLWAPLED